MNTYTLILRDAARSERIEGVQSFVGEDNSGSFGIWAGHGRMMTTLVFGLSRFRVEAQTWQYLAMPGAVLYLVNDELTISTRKYFLDDDFERISAALQEELLEEERTLQAMRLSLRRMEQEMLKRLRDLGKEEALFA